MSVDDWYANRAHRDDLDPGYDRENDDVRDPFEFGATPELRTPSRDRRKSATRSDRRQQVTAPSSESAGSEHRGSNKASKRKRSGTGSRRDAVIRVMLAGPPRPLADYQKALAEAGHGRVPWSEIEADIRRLGGRRASAKPAAPNAADASTRRTAETVRPTVPAPALGNRPSNSEPAGSPVVTGAAAEQAGQGAWDRYVERVMKRSRAGIDKIVQRRRGKRGKASRKSFQPKVVQRSQAVTAERCPSCDMVPHVLTGMCRCG